MGSSLLVAFDNFPRERELIGRMILAYSDIEFVMMDIMSAVLKDAQTAVRTLFQLRSESNRIAVAEAIAMPWFNQAGLGGQFKEGVDAANHCKNIRNQYAHCQFIEAGGILRFCNLEETAKSKGAVCEVRARPISLALLEKQSAYFDYADHMLLWLDYTYRIKHGQPTHTGGEIPKPRRVSPPKLDSRGEARSH